MSLITPNLTLVLDALKRGEVAAIPTETVYGLAADATNDAAVRQIYALKKRPLNHPLILHVSQQADLTRWVRVIPDYAQQLIKKFWPGPLTLVLPCRLDTVNPLITGGQTTIAIRAPNHPLIQDLLSQLDFPLVAPSANQFGKVSPTTAQHVQESFKEHELLILDGGRCVVGIESTIVDATHEEGYRILRHGLIDKTMLALALPGLELTNDQSQQSIRVSGNLKTHYQPEKPLYYYTNLQDAKQFCAQHPSTYLLTMEHYQQSPPLSAPSHHALSNDPAQFAYELYYQLRAADQTDCAVILIELPPNSPSWQGARERIMKAGRDLQKKS